MIAAIMTTPRLSPDTSIRRIAVADAYALRRRVLRNADPGARVHIAEDDRADAFHIGAVRPDGTVVATASFYPIPLAARPTARRPYQLRFMAVAPECQGQGTGGRVLASAIADLTAAGADLLWANARDTALQFYLRHGFTTVGDSFIEPATGLSHTVVVRAL